MCKSQKGGYFLSMAPEPILGHCLLISNASWVHSNTPQSVGVPWKDDQPDKETSTW